MLHLYDTATRKKVAFTPLDPERVTLYVCGPTVYDHIHIGNARPLVVFDVLVRVLRFLYPQVIYARNLTDIDDKILDRAVQENCRYDELTARYIEAFHEVCAALGGSEVDLEPRATETIPAMLEMIQTLLDSDHAYEADGHVLFAVDSFDGYGELSGRRVEEMHPGARVEVAEYKRNPADFVLWKPSTPEQPGWDSPFGRGRPGWHLECSCMIAHHLGPTIDIHGGGQDLVFPHHENERAQSCCAYPGESFVRLWMHNGYVTVDGEKMAKSIGNVRQVRDLLDHHPGELLRLALLHAHYRKPLDWTDDLLLQARQILDRLYRAWQDAGSPEPDETEPDAEFLQALLDDLNTPLALQRLRHEAAALAHLQGTQRTEAARRLCAGARMLGLFESAAEDWFHAGATAESLDDAEIEALLAERQAARENGDYAAADRIRDQLLEAGIAVEDLADGSHWRRVR